MGANHKTIKPKALNHGSLIALIAPAGAVKQEQLDKAQKSLSEMGFRSCFTPDILDRKGYLAGDDETRLNDLHRAFERKGIDAILCIRGGYGASRIVDQIDYDLIKQNPKIFIGYSDITVLLNAIYQNTGLVTFHGVLGVSAFPEYTRSMFKSLLKSKSAGFVINSENENSTRCIYPGKAKGRLAGGNLSLIVSLWGTKYQVDFDKKLVFLEEIGEAPYRIDRMLTQLLLSGCLQKAAGIILGNFKGCDLDNEEITAENSFSLAEVFKERIGNLKIPVIADFSFGHLSSQAIFPVGIEAEMDAEFGILSLLEAPVK